ncbi:protein transport protein S31, partial [Tulasnella sp. 417]
MSTSSTTTLTFILVQGIGDHWSRNTIYISPSLALDFNDFQRHVMLSPGINGSVWGLHDPNERASLGARRPDLGNAAVVTWTPRLQPIPATSGNSNCTATLHLRGKWERVMLGYDRGAVTYGVGG